MAKVYYENDGDLKALTGKTVAVIGYGSQGHAHALNLRDSGLKVIVGEVRPSTPQAKAKEAGFEVVDAAEAARRGDLIALLIPDHVQSKAYKEQIEPNLSQGKTLLFVSHSTGAVANLCERALWLDHGNLAMDGEATQVVAAYEGAALLKAGQ